MKLNFTANKIHFLVSDAEGVADEAIRPLIKSGFREANPAENGRILGPRFTFTKLANFINHSTKKTLKQMTFLVRWRWNIPVSFDDIYQLSRLAQAEGTSYLVILEQHQWSEIFYLMSCLGAKPAATQEDNHKLVVSFNATDVINQFGVILSDLTIPNLESFDVLGTPH